jgi:hypothetical protein
MAEGEAYPLADLIKALGTQLREAQRRHQASQEPGLLRLKECTVELGLSWEKKGEAGVEFWIIKLGGGITKQNTQTLSVTLEPIGATVVLAEEESSAP